MGLNWTNKQDLIDTILAADVNALAAAIIALENASVKTHASAHATGGEDALTPAQIGAAAAVSRLTPSGGTANLTVADNTEYRFSSAVTSLTLTFPAGNFDCWLRFTSGDSITVTLPASATYIGGAPAFEASKTYEMSIKDGVVLCAEVTTE
ncbi:MAG: hypothetical protein PUC97_01295 [bacterium]|nr:hypothetical protein [bacterium]